MNKKTFIISLAITLCLEAIGAEHYISRTSAAVVPERIQTLPLIDPGMVEICHREEGHVAKGTLLVKINANELAYEEAEMKNLQRQNAALAEETILQLKRKKEELEFILSQPAERRAFMEERFKMQADKNAIKILNEKIEIQKETLRLSNLKLQQAFDKRCKTRLIYMPFDGRIQYHINISDEKGEQLIPQTGPLLTAVDDSILYIAISPENAELVNLPPQKLILKLELGGGDYLHADWHHKKVEVRNNRETLIYYFAVAEKNKKVAWNLLGTSTIAKLYYKTSDNENVQYIHKTELAKEAGETPFETWEELVKSLRPGYKILFTGETHIGLTPAT